MPTLRRALLDLGVGRRRKCCPLLVLALVLPLLVAGVVATTTSHLALYNELTADYDYPPKSDEGTYFRLAKQRSRGEEMVVYACGQSPRHAYWQPGFVAIFSPLLSWYGEGPAGLQALRRSVLFMGLLVPFAAGAVAMRLVRFSRTRWLACGLAFALLALDTSIASSGAHFMSDIPGLLFALLGVLLLSFELEGTLRWVVALAGGGLLGASALCRPELSYLLVAALLVLAVHFVVLRFRCRLSPHVSERRGRFALGVAAAGFAAVMAALLSHNYHHTGALILSSKGPVNLVIGNNRRGDGTYMPATGALTPAAACDPDEARMARTYARAFRAYVREEPKRFQAVLWRKARMAADAYSKRGNFPESLAARRVLVNGVLATAALGLLAYPVYLWRRFSWWVFTPVATMFVGGFVIVVMVFVARRFMLTSYVAAVILASATVAELTRVVLARLSR